MAKVSASNAFDGDAASDNSDAFLDELKPGTELMGGQYTISKFINSGGFGITYLAKDSLDRNVVIKECFPGSFCRRSNLIVGARSRAHQNEFAAVVKLFIQEARSLSRLAHPNIVGVHQVFEDNQTAYMALDFIDGGDLLEILEDPNYAPDPALTVHWLRKILDALAFIHNQGVLHRDISPDNILVNRDGEPILIDFGAARAQATKATRALSALRVVKDGYSPQEFYIAGSTQNPSSDLYALGATFYHVVTGDAPINSQVRLAAIAEGRDDPYEPLSGRYDGYPPVFLRSIDQALKVLPKERIQSAEEWLSMLAISSGDVSSTSTGEPKKKAVAVADEVDELLKKAVISVVDKQSQPVTSGGLWSRMRRWKDRS
ncbi:MAG: serine/threonine protein kinase [Rhodobacteraceae bacterium]|nr:serine/threonine protein kinase [Paracoccaceae bacterium]